MAKAIDLISDNLKSSPLWSAFAEIAQNVYDTKLGEPLRELERLRHIDSNTDPVLVERAIRQAGLNLTNELFQLNRENLTLNYHELIKFWEHNGTPRYTQAIAFILGRTFSETVLYTTDYIDFEPSPGRLNVDGGSWYSTSHVDLQVEANSLRESLNLRIQPEDIPAIKSALNFDQSTDAEKNAIIALISDLQRREIDLESDDVRIISVLVRNRILKTYYQFAPIEKVVREIYLTIVSRQTLLIASTSLARPRKYFESSANEIVGYDLSLPSKLQGIKAYSSNIRVTWSDTTRTEQFPLSIQDDTLQSEVYPNSIRQIDGDLIESVTPTTITFKDVDDITEITLEIRVYGIVWQETFELYPVGIPFEPDELYMTGPQYPVEDSSNVYQLVARFDNVREPADPDRVTWTTDSTVASFVGNRLTVSEIFDPVSANITARYRNLDDSFSTVTKAVTLTPAPKDVVAKNLRIIVEARQDDGTWTEIDPTQDIEQGFENIYLTPAVVLSDNTEILLASRHTEEMGDATAPIAQWSSSTGIAYVEPDGRLVAPIIFREFIATLTALYTYQERIVSGAVDIRFKRPRIFIESIEILGADSVLEETRSTYQLQATWNTGQVTIVEPDWNSRASATALAGQIDSRGVLFAPTVDADSEDINVDAVINTVQFDGNDQEIVVTMTTTKTVTVRPLDRRVNVINFQMLDSLRQGNTNSARFYADWNDGTETEIIPYRIELVREDEIISTYIRDWDGAIQDTYVNTSRNPITLQTDPGDGINPPESYTAPEDGVDHPRFQIDYNLPDDLETVDSFNGLIDVRVYYVNPIDVPDSDNPPVLDDATLESLQGTEALVVGSRTISVIPRIFLSESIEIIAPVEMRESTRVFLAALVTYENGDTEQVNAQWELQTLFPDQEIEADLSQGRFTLERIVNGLLGINRAWFDANTLSTQQIDDLINGEIVFRALSESSIADWTTTVRDLIDSQSVSTQLTDAAIPQDQSAIEGAFTPVVDQAWLEAGNELDATQIIELTIKVDMFKVLADQNPNRTEAEWTSLLLNALQAYPTEPQYERALIQTRPIPNGEDQQFRVNVNYFRQDDTVLITNVSDPVLPINEVFSARVEGPGDIVADRNIFYSYELIVDFDDQGRPYAASNGWRVEVENKLEVLEELLGGADPSTWNPTYTGFIPTRNDLSLTPLVELTEDQLEEIFQDLVVVEIDTNGYLYPRISVNADLVIYADFDDNIQQFTRSMPVVLRPANSIITGMTVLNVANDGVFTRITNRTPLDDSDINGVIKISDVPVFSQPTPVNTLDSFQKYDGDLLVYTFRARVERTDDKADENGFFSPRVVEWNLATSSTNIYLGTPNQDTITIIVDPVTDDQEVIIRGRYSEDFARSEESFTPGSLEGEDRLETVNAALRFIVESSTAIDIISNVGSDTVFDNLTGPFVPSVSITRRNGDTVSNPNSLIEWRILGGPLGLSYDEDAGGFIIPTLQSNTTMTLRAIATEGSRTISADFVFNLQQAFQPQGIELILPQTYQDGLIDTSITELGSELISFDSSRQDATDKTFFYFAYEESDATIVENRLNVQSIPSDKTIRVTLRSEDFPNTQTEKNLVVYSSYPLFTTLVAGLTNTTTVFNDELRDPTNDFLKLLSRTGGTFEVDPDSDEYGYFMHPKSLGIAQFNYIPEVNSAEALFGDWQGLGSTPVEIEREYVAGLTETWYVYRTQQRGFARGRFAVTYQPE